MVCFSACIKINHLAMPWHWWRCNRDFPAYALFVSHCQDTNAVFIPVIVGLKLVAHTVDQVSAYSPQSPEQFRLNGNDLFGFL